MRTGIIIGAILLSVGAGDIAGAPATAPVPDPQVPNVLIIGASSLAGLSDLLNPMMQSKGIQMNIDETWVKLDAVDEMLKAKPAWDYVIMDAWHFGRGRTASPDFPDAVTNFVKRVRAHSPNCKIILFPWWLPSPNATNDDVMEVFHRCVDAAKSNHIWVATTGPAFTEARLDRTDLKIVRSKTDAHPGPAGSYINACSLFAAITGQSPVGLPATLTRTPSNHSPPPSAATRPVEATNVVCAIAPPDALYLQELAWKVYQREIKNIKPAE